MKTCSSDLCPELTEVNLHFTSIPKHLYNVSWALVGVKYHLVTSNINLRLVVSDVVLLPYMVTFPIGY